MPISSGWQDRSLWLSSWLCTVSSPDAWDSGLREMISTCYLQALMTAPVAIALPGLETAW
eukprot:CAMPEP_0179421644 /NCGR_PEP_ID=MMETSP0799-20121207/9913_1 /TAXON_ID=46947 /ORGANISM="Geminigera cryophila, Strain CCMP2564" /LENGTH=59 /DNA_ID=CAMNT_0021195539 /DNA_START=656 /DNA_END=832 /DNA_ORIENTATION=-